MRRPLHVFAVALVLAVACTSPTTPENRPSQTTAASSRANVGGYELAYACEGSGTPTVVLEAGLGSAGLDEWASLMPDLEPLGVRVCTYDRAGVGMSDERPGGGGPPTAETQADELHRLLEEAAIETPVVLVPHSYGGLVARVFADRYPGDVAGFVFEDVSTAWEIDLWPRWDDSPWVDGAQTIDIDTTERQVLDAAPLGARPSIVVSQATYDGEGVPGWAAKIFARHQARLAELGEDVIHVRADGSGHFIHRERPTLIVVAIAEVVDAVSAGRALGRCDDVFEDERATCL
jgi:pimeloyl-ACP methyl ester carboxylesterase